MERIQLCSGVGSRGIISAMDGTSDMKGSPTMEIYTPGDRRRRSLSDWPEYKKDLEDIIELPGRQ